jgi:hypothetical protein
VGLVVVIVLGVGLVVGAVLVTRADPRSSASADLDDEPPLAVVSVIDTAAEVPPSDLYLVELGQPLDEGILLKEDVHELDSVALSDGRVLVTYEVLDDDGEQVVEVGAVVADPAARTVDAIDEEANASQHAGRTPTWDDDRHLLRLYSRCWQWAASAPGSGFTGTDCPADTAVQPRVARAWMHTPTGRTFERVQPGSSLEGGMVELPPSILWLVERDGSRTELASGHVLMLFDASYDATTTLVGHEGDCDEPGFGRCGYVLDLVGEAGARQVAKSGPILAAYLLDDGHIVYSVRHSTTEYPYPDESFLTTVTDPDDRTSLYDGTVEALVGHDTGLVPLNK